MTELKKLPSVPQKTKIIEKIKNILKKQYGIWGENILFMYNDFRKRRDFVGF